MGDGYAGKRTLVTTPWEVVVTQKKWKWDKLDPMFATMGTPNPFKESENERYKDFIRGRYKINNDPRNGNLVLKQWKSRKSM